MYAVCFAITSAYKFWKTNQKSENEKDLPMKELEKFPGKGFQLSEAPSQTHDTNPATYPQVNRVMEMTFYEIPLESNESVEETEDESIDFLEETESESTVMTQDSYDFDWTIESENIYTEQDRALFQPSYGLNGLF